tara:strand:- start:993 stop:1160 length:168 start_codon:yes stop_codon:yes gene_type:complete
MTFRTNTINSFKQVKKDIMDFKSYVFEWFNIIITNQKKLCQKVRQLEKRIEQLEK